MYHPRRSSINLRKRRNTRISRRADSVIYMYRPCVGLKTSFILLIAVRYNPQNLRRWPRAAVIIRIKWEKKKKNVRHIAFSPVFYHTLYREKCYSNDELGTRSKMSLTIKVSRFSRRQQKEKKRTPTRRDGLI